MVWYPSVDLIIEIHCLIMKQYEGRDPPFGINRERIEGIIDRLEHGLPFRNIDFWERTARFIYDMSNLHCFEDGNKRVTQLTLEKSLKGMVFSLMPLILKKNFSWKIFLM